jgi:hypothetical protein
MRDRLRRFILPSLLLLCTFPPAYPVKAAAQQSPLAVAAPSTPSAIDLQADRQLLTPVGKNWRFHAGDDPHWADPGFNDSVWKVFQPREDWTAQGYSTKDDLLWFRFQLKVPPDQASLVLLMPRIDMAYQVFANGQLVGQAGSLPPESPLSPESASRIFTLPVLDSAKPMVVAIRLWHDPRLTGIAETDLLGNAYVGGSGPTVTIFELSKAWNLLAHGNEYTVLLLGLIVGASSLLLFVLTRQGFYGWFALSLFVGTLDLPFRLAAEHFGWGFFSATFGYAALDFLATASFVLFVAGALNLKIGKLIVCLIALDFLAEISPILYVLGQISLVWANGLYFFLNTAPNVVLLVLMIRGWRSGGTYAKLLLPPFVLDLLVASSTDLGHFLMSLNVPHASTLLFSNLTVLARPFLVTVGDAAGVVSTLGLLAVLVYRFARSSREEQRLSSALQTAHDIQHSLVPVHIPRLGGLTTEIVYLAAEEVGGDFCQVLPRADGSILIVIGDVSGKGLQAAMLGTLAVGALRSIADEDVGPAAALERLNNVLLRTANKGFITCLCLNLTPGGMVIMANAGHLSPYLNGEELPTAAGLPLGIVQDMEYEQTTFLLPETARLTLMSDGVVEARAKNGELFGFDRTIKVSRLPASEIAAQASRFGQEDDITVITLDWRAPSLA